MSYTQSWRPTASPHVRCSPSRHGWASTSSHRHRRHRCPHHRRRHLLHLLLHHLLLLRLHRPQTTIGSAGGFLSSVVNDQYVSSCNSLYMHFENTYFFTQSRNDHGDDDVALMDLLHLVSVRRMTPCSCATAAITSATCCLAPRISSSARASSSDLLLLACSATSMMFGCTSCDRPLRTWM